jgi:hypothetical protein
VLRQIKVELNITKRARSLYRKSAREVEEGTLPDRAVAERERESDGVKVG